MNIKQYEYQAVIEIFLFIQTLLNYAYFAKLCECLTKILVFEVIFIAVRHVTKYFYEGVFQNYNIKKCHISQWS